MENLNGLTKEALASGWSEEFAALVKKIVADIECLTLSNVNTYFGRLIYFASLRDHSTGRYFHEGLMARYSNEEAVHEAISLCHSKSFTDFVNFSLEEQTREVSEVLGSQEEPTPALLRTWRRLRSFEILHPEKCHPIARELFARNVEIILKVLQRNFKKDSAR